MLLAAMREYSSLVMPGLVPGIHALLSRRSGGVDGRDKPGHDGALSTLLT
jgi:hypothetical protein